ncbi:hypothetical protein AB3S75_028155 [Citrus x aurantiifolia]
MNNIYAKHSSKRIKERKLRSTRFSVTVYLCFDLKRERMESDKRKRSEKEKNEERKNNNNDNNNSKKKKQKQHAIEKVEKEATEEEVEEFFAILRRIQAAVDYFGGEGWRAVAEAAVDVIDKDADEDKEEEIVKVNEDINDGVLDLNAVPEADSQSH